ncbi:hypothetical protein HY212_03580 [Candidatus Pacearchaeota archaeon]|nr:hypothetical protein [Candidatus Pacearchaeota archaeon]
MDNCAYFKVGYRDKEIEKPGVVVRINEEGALEQLSTDNNSISKFNLMAVHGFLVYNSSKFSAKRITKLEAERMN